MLKGNSCEYWKCRLYIHGCGFGFGTVSVKSHVIYGDPRCDLCPVWDRHRTCNACMYHKRECDGLGDATRKRKLGKIAVKHHINGCGKLWRAFDESSNELCPFCSGLFSKIQNKKREHIK